MNLNKHLRQTVTLERKGVGFDQYGAPASEAPVEVAAFYLPKEGTVRTATGQEVDAESYVLLAVDASLGDRVEGSEIKRIESIVRKGQVIGRECYL